MTSQATTFSIAIAGSISAAFSTFSVYPLDTIKTHLNKGVDPEGKKLNTVREVLERIVLRVPGGPSSLLRSLSILYAGVGSKMVMSMIQKFLYFYIYNYLLSITKSGRQNVSVITNLLVGYVSALVAVGILTPLEVAQTRQQLEPSYSRSITAILADLYKSGGIYRGFRTNVILCINPSIEYTVFDQIKRRRRKGKTLSDSEAFWLGAFSKAVATFFTFPLVRAKVLQQSGLEKFKGMDANSIIVKLIVSDGIGSIFAGMQTQLIKNVIASAIMLSMKERIERTVLTSFR